MSQVAREAIASINESAPTITGSLYVYESGFWGTYVSAEFAPDEPLARAPIQHYADAEQLADALRASL